MSISKKVFMVIIINCIFIIIVYLFNSNGNLLKNDLDNKKLNIIEEWDIEDLIEKINYKNSLCKDIISSKLWEYDYLKDFEKLARLSIFYSYFKAIWLEKYDYLQDFDIPWKYYIQKEYNLTKALNKKNCSYIDKSIDEDGYKLCNIYISWNLEELKKFKFSDWEDSNFMYDFLLALDKGQSIEWEEYNFDVIYNFSNYEDKIEFIFEDIWKIPEKEYIFLQSKWKDSYLKELDKQFINECQNLIKEYNEN